MSLSTVMRLGQCQFFNHWVGFRYSLLVEKGNPPHMTMFSCPCYICSTHVYPLVWRPYLMEGQARACCKLAHAQQIYRGKINGIHIGPHQNLTQLIPFFTFTFPKLKPNKSLFMCLM